MKKSNSAKGKTKSITLKELLEELQYLESALMDSVARLALSESLLDADRFKRLLGSWRLASENASISLAYGISLFRARETVLSKRFHTFPPGYSSLDEIKDDLEFKCEIVDSSLIQVRRCDCLSSLDIEWLENSLRVIRKKLIEEHLIQPFFTKKEGQNDVA